MTFVDSLQSDLQGQVYRALHPPRVENPKWQYPEELAQRWILERVVSLGWSPERFGHFDRHYAPRGNGRTGHKPERFGKKYQWIAFRELLARLADNYHMTERWGEELTIYRGPWQLFERDLDPTLPPAPRARDEDGTTQLAPTFPLEPGDDWWRPPGPRYQADDEPPQDGWATEVDDIPEFEPLVRVTDSRGQVWVALQAYYNWDDEEREDQGRNTSRPRRDMWSHIYTWVVRRSDADALETFLARTSLMGRWMPEGRDLIDTAYLGEMPWAIAATNDESEWSEVPPQHGTDAPDIEVCPGWVEYTWEGNVWDCSIDDTVRARLPVRTLFDAGRLRWQPGSRKWLDEDGNLAAQFVRTVGPNSHSALMVPEKWLAEALDACDCSLVVGWLGEKQLFGGGWNPHLRGDWTEINGVATFAGSRWRFGERRLIRQRRS